MELSDLHLDPPTLGAYPMHLADPITPDDFPVIFEIITRCIVAEDPSLEGKIKDFAVTGPKLTGGARNSFADVTVTFTIMAHPSQAYTAINEATTVISAELEKADYIVTEGEGTIILKTEEKM